MAMWRIPKERYKISYCSPEQEHQQKLYQIKD